MMENVNMKKIIDSPMKKVHVIRQTPVQEAPKPKTDKEKNDGRGTKKV